MASANSLLCRLCSSKEQIVNVFHSHLENGEQLRLYILLATGIQIKETDLISKMVCHRCCEISVKLHKYRTNAVANDKLLKEQHGQPYTPPVTDQEELLRIASRISKENNENLTVDSSYSRDALELLNISIKTEVIDEPSNTGTAPTNLFVNKNVFVPPVTVRHPPTNGPLRVQQQCDNRGFRIRENGLSTSERVGVIVTPQCNNIQVSPKILNPTHTVQNSVPLLQRVNSAPHLQQPNSVVPRLQPPNGVPHLQSPNHIPFSQSPKLKYIHPSIKKVLKEHKNIILPMDVFKSDVSPVISIDKSEVSDWYEEYFKSIKKKLSNIVIKKVPDSSHYQIAVSADVQQQNSNLTSNTDNDIFKNTEKSKKHNYRRILYPSDDDSDFGDRDEYQPYSLSTPNDDTTQQVVAKQPDTTQQVVVKQPDLNISYTPPVIHKQVQRARKRTARKSHVGRKRSSKDDDDTNEVIPQKKKRIYSNKNAISATNKVDLPRECPADKQEQKVIFTSSLELTPIEQLPELVDCQNIMATCKTQHVFMCPVCSVPCDTKKQLIEHEKTHLTCKFCHTTIKNVQLMKQHLSDSCYISLVKDNAVVRLIRVDEEPSVVKKYPEAFEEPNVSFSSYYNGIANFREFGINIEETEPPVIYNSASDNCAELTTNQDAISIQNTSATIAKNISEQTTLPVVDQNKDNHLEIVCISDDSDDEIECTVISRHKIVEPPKDIEARITQQPTLGPVFVPPQKSVTEKDMIRSLFKKYSNSSEKYENSCQTFSPSPNLIKYTNTNLIILENMFSELLSYRIPIQLESKPKIHARFKDEVAVPPPPTTLECWVHKTPIDIRRPPSAKSNSAASLNTNALNYTSAPNAITKPSSTYINSNVLPQSVQTNIVHRNIPSSSSNASAVNYSAPNAIPKPSSTYSNSNVLPQSVQTNIVHRNIPSSSSNANAVNHSAPNAIPKPSTYSNSNVLPQSVQTNIVHRNIPSSSSNANFTVNHSAPNAIPIPSSTYVNSNVLASKAIAKPSSTYSNSNVLPQMINTNIVNRHVSPSSSTAVNKSHNAAVSILNRTIAPKTVTPPSICSTNTAVTTVTSTFNTYSNSHVLPQMVNTNIVNRNVSPSSSTAISKSHNAVVPIGNRTIAVTPQSICSSNNTSSTIVSSAPLSISNNLFVAATTPSSVSVPVISTYSTPNSVQTANFMQIVNPTNTAIMPVQYQAPVPQNNLNSSFGISQTQPALMQLLDTPSTTINHYPMPAQNTGTVMGSYERTEPVYHINSNITNVNKFILVTNNVQQTPLQTQNAMYETSYLNGVRLPPSYEQTLEIREVNKQFQLVKSNNSAQSVQTQNTIRVKNLHELTN